MTANEVIQHLIQLYTEYLEELSNQTRNDFIHGEMTAYVETLEIIQYWSEAKQNGLDYRIEDKYKI